MQRTLPFFKMEGLGNDYVFLDRLEGTGTLDELKLRWFGRRDGAAE